MPVGTRLGAAVDDAGGPVEPPQAVLVGGYAGRWLPPSPDLPLSHAGLRSAAGTLGAGLVLLLPTAACGLEVTARVVRHLAGQGARQCGPCLNGLPALADAFGDLAAGRPPAGTLDRLERWCGLVDGRGACAHPDGVAGLVRSALVVLADDVRTHLGGPCGRDGRLLDGVPA